MNTAVASITPIDPHFFCDGAYYVLLSRSLANSGLDPHALADTLGEGDPEQIADLLERGICLPLMFGGDCAMDGGTAFVVGPLDAAHEQGWAMRLTSKLSIPCGKLVLLAGGGDGDLLERAISGEPPEEHYVVYQTIDVPPGDWRVDVYAYPTSMTVALHHDDLDEDEIAAKYAKYPKVDVDYVVQLTPPSGDVPLPELDPDLGWPGVFLHR